MHCYQEAAQYYQVPARVLRAIHQVEGGKRGERVPDPNGTFDHGFMQINTCWKPVLHQMGWRMRYITNHDCANIFVAAYILRKNLLRTHNLWLAIADYHSSDPVYGYPYLQKVYAHLHAGKKIHFRTTPKTVGSTSDTLYTPQTVEFLP